MAAKKGRKAARNPVEASDAVEALVSQLRGTRGRISALEIEMAARQSDLDGLRKEEAGQAAKLADALGLESLPNGKTGNGKGRRPFVSAVTQHAVLDALKGAKAKSYATGLTVGRLAEALGSETDAVRASVAAALQAREIAKDGERRGTRYFLA